MDKKKLTNYNPKLAINAFPNVDDEIDNSLPVMSRKLFKKLATKTMNEKLMNGKFIVYETKYGNIKFPINDKTNIDISNFDDIVIRILSDLEVRELNGTTIKSGELVIDKYFLETNNIKF